MFRSCFLASVPTLGLQYVLKLCFKTTGPPAERELLPADDPTAFHALLEGLTAVSKTGK